MPASNHEAGREPTTGRASTRSPSGPALRGLAAMMVVVSFIAAIAAWLLLAPPWAAAVSCVALGVIIGAARGLAAALAGAAGLVAAAMFAPILGRAAEGFIGDTINLHGMAGRAVSICIVGLIIASLGAAAVRVPARMLMKRSGVLRGANRAMGAIVGAGAGVVLALAVLWLPLTFATVTRSTRTPEREYAPAGEIITEPARLPPRKMIEDWTVAWAEQIRSTSAGSVVARLNPLADSELLGLTRDFVEISRHPRAMDVFMRTPAMKAIAELPSVRYAVERARKDTQLAEMLERNDKGDGLSERDVMAILKSRTVLEILDEGAVQRDLKPMAEQLKRAIAEAKGMMEAEQSQPGPGGG